jgi:Fe2+ or Zn2+ uptake regulation protein
MQTEFRSALKKSGLRVTPHRIALTHALATAHSPKTADELHARIKNADLVTIYRNLQNLVAANLIHEVRFKDGKVRYELARDDHHHHLVCTGCGTVDELEGCGATGLESKVLTQSQNFASVDEHSLEFFGTCKGCALNKH